MISRYIVHFYLKFRNWIYRSFSNNRNVVGSYRALQPVILRGKGKIVFGTNVKFGVTNSPLYLNTYAYVEARPLEAEISIGNNVNINNAVAIIAEHSITIHDDVLMGYNCHISDSNFHDLEPSNRLSTDPEPKPVVIHRNVFLGNNVTILKGVTIGENSVVAAGSIVTKSFPENVVIGGAPAAVIRSLSN